MSVSRLFRWSALFLLSYLSGAACVAHAEYKQQLILLTWAKYVDPELVIRFEDEFSVDLRMVYYGSDSERDRILSRAAPGDFDLVVIDEVSVDLYGKLGWTAPVSATEIPNVVHIDNQWQDLFPAGQSHAVPYFWGTTGIGYRADLVPSGFESWTEFFVPDESLCGKISLHEDPVAVFAAALKSLGHSVDAATPQEVEAVRRLLTAQRPCVAAYENSDVNDFAKLVTGEVAAAMVYNGDAVTLRDYHSQIKYVVPREGGMIWVDFLAVLEGSTRKQLAYAYINFLNDPVHAAKNALQINCASPNATAASFLPRSFVSDEAIYPDKAVLANSHVNRPLPPRARKVRTRIFVEIMNLDP